MPLTGDFFCVMLDARSERFCPKTNPPLPALCSAESVFVAGGGANGFEILDVDKDESGGTASVAVASLFLFSDLSVCFLSSSSSFFFLLRGRKGLLRGLEPATEMEVDVDEEEFEEPLSCGKLLNLDSLNPGNCNGGPPPEEVPDPVSLPPPLRNLDGARMEALRGLGREGTEDDISFTLLPCFSLISSRC